MPPFCIGAAALPRPRALLLDAGGTLFRERCARAALYADAARRHGIERAEPEVAAAMRAAHAELPIRIDGAFRYSRPWFAAFIRRTFELLGAPPVPNGLLDDLFATFADPGTFAVFDEVVPLLRRLRDAGVLLAVVSNGSPTLPELLAGLRLAPLFDAVVASAAVGAEKPDPAIFRVALDQLGVEPRDAFHVGDRAENDLAGASAAGIPAALLVREGGPRGTWRTLSPAADLFGLPPRQGAGSGQALDRPS